jgi:hypothetical protein
LGFSLRECSCSSRKSLLLLCQLQLSTSPGT